MKYGMHRLVDLYDNLETTCTACGCIWESGTPLGPCRPNDACVDPDTGERGHHYFSFGGDCVKCGEIDR